MLAILASHNCGIGSPILKMIYEKHNEGSMVPSKISPNFKVTYIGSMREWVMSRPLVRDGLIACVIFSALYGVQLAYSFLFQN
jgi:hypothetical protein